MPLDYSKTYIYKICCKDIHVAEIYVGMTTNFEQRRREHRSHCTNESCKKYKSQVYTFIRDNGGWSNWDMVLIDTVNVSNKLEAHKAERSYVESLHAVLNKQTPANTRRDTERKYRQTHKDAIKAYLEANKDKMKEYKKQYRATHKEESRAYQQQYVRKK